MVQSMIEKGDVIDTHADEKGWRAVVAIQSALPEAKSILCVQSREFLSVDQAPMMMRRDMLEWVAGKASPENMEIVDDICQKHGIVEPQLAEA